MHFSGVLIGTQSKAVVDVCAMSTKGLGIKNINVLIKQQEKLPP